MSSNKGMRGSYAGKEGREQGKYGDKNRSLFSPDDWTCKNCYNINWARRTTCNACNTPRVNNLGERTGYGGGFMERDEVVEYRHREGSDSEDEFDEFGRKKKRFRKSANPTPAVGSSPHNQPPDRSHMRKSRKEAVPMTGNNDDRVQNNDNDDEEEEAEESGDDADLSKYDIWNGDEADGSGVASRSGTQTKQTDDASGSATSDSDTESSSSSSSSSSRDQKGGSIKSSSDSSSSEEPEHNGRPRRQLRDTRRDRSRSPLS